MGFGDYQKKVVARQTAAVKNPLAEQQKEAIKYGEGAAGEALSQQQLEANKRQGDKLVAELTSLGQTQGRDFERAATMKAQGFDPDIMEDSFVGKAGKALSWLDKPGAIVRFGLADILGLDTKAGTEFGWEDFKDVWGGNTESLKERHGEDVVGEEGRLGGQALLTIAGWELAEKEGTLENWGKRNFHGAISLGVEMLTDPLTFITGGASAAGKKATLTAAQNLTKQSAAKTVKHILSGASDDGLHAFERVMAKGVRKRADDLLKVAKKELKPGEEMSEWMRRGIYEKAATAEGDDTLRGIGKALANRDYRALPTEFTSYAKQEGQSFLTGGLRISPRPMSKHGWQIPGTQGLGRRVTKTVFGTHAASTETRGFLGREVAGRLGTGVRGALDRNFKATTKWRNMFHGIDADSSIVRAFQEGRPTATALLDFSVAVKGTAKSTGLRQVGHEIGRAGQDLNKALKKHLTTDEADEVFKSMIGHVQDGLLIAKPARHANEAVNEAVNNFVDRWHTGFKKMHEIALANNVEIGHLDNYVPLVRSKEANQLFEVMRDSSLGVVIPEGLTPELQRGYEYLAEMYGAYLRRVHLDRKVVGQFRNAEKRVFGVGVDTAVNDMGDVTIFQRLTGGSGEFSAVNHTQINDEMNAAIVDLAGRHHLPVNPEKFNALEMNPYEIANKYMNSMSDAIMETIMVNEGTRLGLIKGADFKVDRGRMAAALKDRLSSLSPTTGKRVEKTIDDTYKNLGSARSKVARGEPVTPSRKPKIKYEQVGDQRIPIPEHVADDKRVVKAVSQAKRKYDNKLKQRAAASGRATARKQELMKEGLPEPVAKALSDETELEIINDIYRAVQQAEQEDIVNQTAAYVEVVAREVAGAKADAATIKGARAAEKAAHDAEIAARMEASEQARARFRGRNRMRPARTVKFDTEDTTRKFGEHFKPGASKKIDLLAQQAEGLPDGAGDTLAAKLRGIQSTLDGVDEFDDEIIRELDKQLREARNLVSAINGGGDMKLTFEEWVKTRPVRRTKMGALEQERLMDEWLELAPTTSRVPPAPELVTPDPRRELLLDDLRKRQGMNISGEAKDESIRKQVVTTARLLRESGLEIKELGESGGFRMRQIRQGGDNTVWAEDPSGQIIAAAKTSGRAGGSAGVIQGAEGTGVFNRMIQKATADDPDFVITLSLSESVSESMADYIQKWALHQAPADGAQNVAAREAWFEAFAETNGVDLRALLAPDRKKLKTLMTDTPDSPELMAQLQRSKDRILNVSTGRPVPKGQAKSLQHMFLDRVEEFKGARGKRRPAWAKIDVEEARAMEPEDFFLRYHEEFGEGVLTDEFLEGIQDAHRMLYDDGFLGKNLDQSVASDLAEELEVLIALNQGSPIWRNQKLRARLQKMFDESGMGAEYTIRSARGGRFQIETIEQFETLTHKDLMRQLRLAGFTTIEAAAEAAENGTLKQGALSQAALNTLAETPHADIRQLDELAEVLENRVKAIPKPEVDTLDRTVAEAVRTEKTFERLDRAMRKVGADGTIKPSALKEAQAILADPQNMKAFRRMLPRDEWPKLDGIADTLATWEAMKGSDARVRAVLRDNAALRQEYMFDTTEVRNTVRAIRDEADMLRSDETIEGFEGAIEGYGRLAEVIESLYGWGAADPGRGLWATDAELAVRDVMTKEGQRYAKELGLDEIGDVLREVGEMGKVPTTEAEGFIPAMAFGLTGEGIDKRLVQADLGRFMEQTLKNMTAGMTPIGLQSFASQARQVLHWWKGMATVARPTFHIRNAMSAMWNNNMINVHLKDYAFVARHTKEIKSLYKETGDWVVAASRMQDERARFYFGQAAKSGIFDETFTSQEVLGKMVRESTGSVLTKNPLGTKGALLSAGGEAMGTIENYFRMAAFVRHMPDNLLRETDEMMLAAGRGFANDMVNMVHFDYTNLTHVEEKIKQFIPFYVWTRRNLPLQMRALVESPSSIATYNHLIHVGNDMSSSRDEGPRRYGGSMFIGTDLYMNEGTENWAQFILDPDIPVKDLFRIEEPLNPASYLNLAVGMLGPQFGEPLKAVFDEPYQTTAPVGFAAVTRGVKALFDADADLDTNPRISSRTASLMKLVFPPASEFLTAFETDPVRMQKQGIVEGDIGTRVRAGLQDLVLPGLGVQTVTPHSEYSVYQSSAYSIPEIMREKRKSGEVTREDEEYAKLFGPILNP